jgi:hypothetical protein
MFYDNKRVENFSLVTIPITAAGTNFIFPDQPQLRGKKIQKIVVYFNDQYPKSPDNISLVDSSAMDRCFLILYVNEREDLKIPLSNLITTSTITGLAQVNNNGYIPLADLNIMWSKSYVKAPTTYTPTGTEVFQFGVFYKD